MNKQTSLEFDPTMQNYSNPCTGGGEGFYFKIFFKSISFIKKS